MKEFNLKYLYSPGAEKEFYYGDDEFSTYIISIVSDILDKNDFELQLNDLYDCSIDLIGKFEYAELVGFGKPILCFIPTFLHLKYIINEPYSEDEEEWLDEITENLKQDLFLIPEFQRSLIYGIEKYDELYLHEELFYKISFQLYYNENAGKKRNPFCIRQEVPFYFN
ncbi:MAG TPA: hypothetical protein VIQ77_01600 [Mucilaginibacter sp.]